MAGGIGSNGGEARFQHLDVASEKDWEAAVVHGALEPTAASTS